jgi:hypothetical protein
MLCATIGVKEERLLSLYALFSPFIPFIPKLAKVE